MAIADSVAALGEESADAAPVGPGPAGPEGQDQGPAGPEGQYQGPGGLGGPVLPTTVRPRGGLKSRRRQVIAFGILAAALLVLVVRGLGNATEYFKTADEAVADRAQLGTRQFRIEGTVQPDVHQVGQTVAFVIANNGVSVKVIHTGSPPQLFKPGIPVVLEGHFATDGHFASDLIEVKHTASYVAAHPDRVITVPPTPASIP